jgi:hypothetical protein
MMMEVRPLKTKEKKAVEGVEFWAQAQHSRVQGQAAGPRRGLPAPPSAETP